MRPDINLKTTSRFQGVEARDGVDAQVSFEKKKLGKQSAAEKLLVNEGPSWRRAKYVFTLFLIATTSCSQQK